MILLNDNKAGYSKKPKISKIVFKISLKYMVITDFNVGLKWLNKHSNIVLDILITK